MISCEKAAKLIDKRGAEKLSFWEKINLRVHNLHCKACRAYERFSKRFDEVIKRIKLKKPQLTMEEKEKIKAKLIQN